MIGKTILAMLGLLEELLLVLEIFGAAFLNRMIELLETPWLVKR